MKGEDSEGEGIRESLAPTAAEDFDLQCFQRPGSRIEIEPSSPRRDWMDATRRAVAYRCLPLVAANTHGWEILCPHSFELEWNGGKEVDDLQIFPDPSESLNKRYLFAQSHFGSGILTLVPDVVMRSPPEYNLWVTGSPNRFKDGIQALSALIETDWMPYTFTMNWKVTRPNYRIRFEKGESYCFFFPILRGRAELMNPSIHLLEDDAELASRYRKLYELRRSGVQSPEKPVPRAKEQAWYANGLLPDSDVAIAGHQRRIRLKAFRKC